MCSDTNSLTSTSFECFGNIYSTSTPTLRDIEAVIECSDCVMGDQMNEVLSDSFSEAEIRIAVFDMHPSKAPGPDGFTAIFCQKLWPIIGKDITKAAM